MIEIENTKEEKCICEAGEVEEHGFYDIGELKVSAGIFGELLMDAFVDLGPVPKIIISLDGITPDGYNINDDTYKIEKPIKYCPYCGRRLMEE